MVWATSSPAMSVPTMAYCPLPPGASAASAEAPVTMKNWLPAVPFGSLEPFAMATVPEG